MNKTDWDQYYNSPSLTSLITRKITAYKLNSLIKKFYTAPIKDANILELGGANSCFYHALNNSLRPKTYTIIDNNEVGLKKFEAAHVNCANTFLVKHDLLDDIAIAQKYDIVFSVGLIEHFSPEDTQKIIRSHFSLVNSAGLVIISFPTATWLYRLSRRIIEFFGLWGFPDERPLTFTEVNNEVNKYAIKLYEIVNWCIILTQGIVVYASKECKCDHISENSVLKNEQSK